ncbi:PAS domain S-box protein [Aestuariibacter sp. GS-14]|uniref:PAS domain S-box protein n=1 Tax=Aestuariibacter sp. GS-14 TaxID=2590670 RepID=UPI00112BFE0D|nr:PAS domain S-box protein [Aestuariibacter sp. GS-14]TPV56949.1 PAS domain S-box protein [Aestuariibacter sp. GS-14]
MNKKFKSTTLKNEIHLLSNLIENASDGIHILNKNGDVIYCSKVFAELLGYDYHEALTLNVRDWDRKFPVEELLNIIQDIIKSPRLFHTRHMRKNGEIFDAEINARGFEIDGIHYLYASTRDVTVFKRDALESKKNSAKLQSIFHTMPDAVFVINAEGIIESVNEKGLVMFKYEESELIGKNISILMPPEHSQHHDGYLQRYIATGTAHILGKPRELKAVKKTGEVFPIELSVGEATTESGQLFTGIIRDITWQKSQQAALIESEKLAKSAAEAKSLFLANMSHEIRTPMNGIIGTLSLFKDDNLSTKQREMLTTVRSCGESLLTIINDILDFSKIESGKLQIEQVNFDLREAVHEVLLLVSNIASKRGISIHSHFTDTIPQYLVGDVVRIRQILMNILSNAIKFSGDSDDIWLNVILLSEQNGKFHLKFSVKDQGIGMTQEEQSRLFVAFSQAEEGITRKYGGTGLGLSICAKLLELMGGSISVESEKYIGSTFSFELPFGKGALPKEKATKDNYDNLSEKYPHQVLLVEDNMINQIIAQTMLETLGYYVTIANNGQEAIDLFKLHKYTLIFMDMQMPVMDGITATAEILKLDSSALVIAMTANALNEDKEKCLNTGMKAFITKPIQLNEIARAIIHFSATKPSN